MVRIIRGTMWILQMLKCVVGTVTIVLSSGSTSQNFARYCADCTYICVFTNYTDSYLHTHVDLSAVNFNNIVIYIYIYTCIYIYVYVYICVSSGRCLSCSNYCSWVNDSSSCRHDILTWTVPAATVSPLLLWPTVPFPDGRLMQGVGRMVIGRKIYEWWTGSKTGNFCRT